MKKLDPPFYVVLRGIIVSIIIFALWNFINMLLPIGFISLWQAWAVTLLSEITVLLTQFVDMEFDKNKVK